MEIRDKDNQEQDKMLNREGCEIADAMFEITRQCCDQEDWYPAMCHCAEVNGTFTFFADIMLKVTQLCEISEELHQAMRHCAEMVCSYNYLGFDTNDVIALLRYEGNLSSFEVSVNEKEENRMVQLTEQMKSKLDSYGCLTAVLINFYKTDSCHLKMEEFKAIPILYDSIPYEFDILWGLSPDKRCTEPILRATVLVMHKSKKKSL
jgi:cell division GTPase FtsZ